MSQPKTRLALTWLHCLETGIHCQYQWVLGSSSYFAWELFASPRHCRQPFERYMCPSDEPIRPQPHCFLQTEWWPLAKLVHSARWCSACISNTQAPIFKLYLKKSSTGISLLLAFYTAWFDNLQFMLDFRFCKTMSRTTVCGMFSHITRADQNHPVVESNQRKHNIRHVKKESSNLMKIGLGTKMNARILGIWANWNRQQRFQKSPFMQSLESIIQTHSRSFWHPRSLDWSILSRDPGRQMLSSPKCKFISGWRAKNIFNALPPQ